MFFNNFQTVIISLIFTTIEDEARLSGLKIQNIFSKAFKKDTFIKFDSSFISSLQADETALLQYRLAMENGMCKTEAFSATMTKASVEAQNFARSTEITGESLNKFTANQKMSELSLIAQNKKLGNIKTLLNEYNLGMKNCGLSQDQFIESVTKSNPVLGKYLSGVESGKATMRGYVGSLVAGKAATIGLQFATMALNTAISFGLSYGISKLIGFISDAINSANELKKATIDTAKESTDHIKELESSLKSYLELDTTATEADKANVLKSVTEQLGNKTEALKNATEAEKGYVEAVKESIVADYDEAAKKARDARVLAEEQLNKNTIWDGKGVILWGKDDVYNNIVKPFIDKNDNIYAREALLTGEIDIKPTGISGDAEEQAKGYLKYYETLLAIQDTIRKKAQELGKEGDALLESDTYKAIMSTLNDETFKGAVDEYVFSYSNEVYNSAIVENGIPETVEQFNNLKDTMLQQVGDSTLLADSITNRLNTAYCSLAEEAVKAEHSVSTLDFTITDDEIEKQLKDLQEALSKVTDNYKKISGVIDDYNKNGNMSIENLETLISVGDEYLSTLFDENGKLNLNKESYKKLAKARLEDIRYTMLENAISSINKLNKDDEATSNDNLATSTGNLTEETLKLVAAKKLAEGVDSSQIKKIIDTYYQWSSLIDNTEAGLENNIDATLGLENASEELKDSLESEKKSLENSKSALEDKKKALEDTKEGYETALDSIKSLIEWTEKYIKQTKEDEIKSLEEKKNAIDEQIDKQKELLQAEKDLHDYEQSLGEKQNTVASNALTTSIASLDDSASGQKTYKQTQEEYKNSKDDLQDFLYDHNIEVREDALDKFKEDTDKSYESQIDTIQKYLDNEVQLHKDACSMIDNDNGELYGNLLNYCRIHTTTTEAEFNHMWQAAQSAMQEYNITNVGTFELLSSLQSRIYEVDATIDVVADSISSYEYKIQGVQDSLTALSDSAIKAQNDIAKAMQDNNKRNEINKAKWYYDWQGVRYQSKEVERDSAIYDILHQIEKKYGGSLPASTSTIYGTIKKYATGTKSAKGGLSEIDENGKLETLMKQTPNGNYIIMDKGDQVFTKEQTNNLHDVSEEPSKFIYDNVDLNALAEKGLRPLTNKELSNLGLWNSRYSLFDNDVNIPNITNVSDKIYKDVVGGANLNDVVHQNVKQSINANFYNTFNGDVTPQMLRLMEKKEKDIVKKSVNEMIETTLKGRKWR